MLLVVPLECYVMRELVPSNLQKRGRPPAWQLEVHIAGYNARQVTSAFNLQLMSLKQLLCIMHINRILRHVIKRIITASWWKTQYLCLTSMPSCVPTIVFCCRLHEIILIISFRPIAHHIHLIIMTSFLMRGRQRREYYILRTTDLSKTRQCKRKIIMASAFVD